MSFVDRGDPGCGDGFEDKDYARVGIDAAEARAWRRWGIEPIDARRWRDAGIDDPVEAVRWSPAVKPEQVQELKAKGLTSSLLARWREHGASVEEALAGIAAGRDPEERTNQASLNVVVSFRQSASGRGRRARALAQEASDPPEQGKDLVREYLQGGEAGMSYLRIGWLDEQARVWASTGIDAVDARDWLALGLTPQEALECEDAGLGATDVALMWWRAGFSPDEVGPWLGAGLTPEEARKQQDEGVTLEQAEVLRSLRRGESGA